MTEPSPIRLPAVAGTFYPADPGALARTVRDCLADAKAYAGPEPVAVVAPHAGYVYSGPVAGSAYAAVGARSLSVESVVVVGPSHHVALRGFAVPEAGAFRTPLGLVQVDSEAAERAAAHPWVVRSDVPHGLEHSLEVQLPFLQETLGDVPVLPVVAGRATATEAAAVLEHLWAGPSTLLVVSSDLSHYLPYDEARRVDRRTADAVEALRWEDVDDRSACGAVPLRGLLEVARRRRLTARTVDLRNSGDTAGPRSQVVGYGAFVFGAT